MAPVATATPIVSSPGADAVDVARGAAAGLQQLAPFIVAGAAFLALFWEPLATLARDWWNEADAGHGLLLAPLSLWLAWKRGLAKDARGQRVLGAALLIMSILMRYASGMAAELFTMRMSMLGAAGALVIYFLGVRQLRHWWLPTALLLLSVPLPTVVLGTLALPLQLQASEMGAALLEWRHVPVLLAGNVIHLPERTLFVTEACSGLRSLTALLALSVLIGGLWLRSPWLRLFLVAASIPIAMMLNGIRIFLTGFLVYFVDPKLGDGLMHYSEGWAMFAVAFGILGGVAWVLSHGERGWSNWRQSRSRTA